MKKLLFVLGVGFGFSAMKGMNADVMDLALDAAYAYDVLSLEQQLKAALYDEHHTKVKAAVQDLLKKGANAYLEVNGKSAINVAKKLVEQDELDQVVLDILMKGE